MSPSVQRELRWPEVTRTNLRGGRVSSTAKNTDKFPTGNPRDNLNDLFTPRDGGQRDATRGDCAETILQNKSGCSIISSIDFRNGTLTARYPCDVNTSYVNGNDNGRSMGFILERRNRRYGQEPINARVRISLFIREKVYCLEMCLSVLCNDKFSWLRKYSLPRKCRFLTTFLGKNCERDLLNCFIIHNIAVKET